MDQKNNGILLYVDRENIPIDKHYSENQIQSLEDFIIIQNNSTLQDLENTINNLILSGVFYEKI